MNWLVVVDLLIVLGGNLGFRPAGQTEVRNDRRNFGGDNMFFRCGFAFGNRFFLRHNWGRVGVSGWWVNISVSRVCF